MLKRTKKYLEETIQLQIEVQAQLELKASEHRRTIDEQKRVIQETQQKLARLEQRFLLVNRMLAAVMVEV